MPRILLPIIALVGLLLAGIAFDKPSPRADFVFINNGDVSTLDPAIISWLQDNRVARMISEGLTRVDIFTDSFDMEPAAAESWELSADKRTYTFRIRPNAKWTNGEPVRAGDFVFSWRRSMLPDLAGDYIKLYTLIEGGDAFITWRSAALKEFSAQNATRTDESQRVAAANELWNQTLAKFDELVQLKAPDDHTLIVTLTRPTPYFLDLVAFPPMFPVYPPLVKAYESIDSRTGLLKSRPDWTKPPLSITNGPFALKSWRFKRDMLFEQNPHYWNRANLSVRTIAIPSVQDANAKVLAFRTGAVDYVTDVVPSYRMEMLRDKRAFYAEHQAEFDRLSAQFPQDPIEVDRQLPKDPRNTLHVFPAFGTYFYNFNCRPKLSDGTPNPLADARVRKALALAVDKQSVTDNIRQVGEPVANTIVPRATIPNYESPKGLERNITEARRLLAEAGFGPNNKFSLDILFNKDAGHDLIAQTIAKDWERELGISVRLNQVEIKVFRERLKSGDFMVSRGSWFGDYGDPTTFLNLSRTGDGNNDRGYTNPAYDALLDQAENAPTPQERLNLLSQAERMLVEDELPILPIFQYVQLYLFDPHTITGISSHPRMEQQMHRIDVFGDRQGSDQPKLMRKGVGREGAFKLLPSSR
ncbi:MAG: peptide ABC transporter substrate-binding protein [Phycisphaerales bacterium]